VQQCRQLHSKQQSQSFQSVSNTYVQFQVFFNSVQLLYCIKILYLCRAGLFGGAGCNEAIYISSASAVNIYSATSSLVRFGNENIFLYNEKCNAGVVVVNLTVVGLAPGLCYVTLSHISHVSHLSHMSHLPHMSHMPHLSHMSHM
jgi:hypothetical protein